MVYLNLRMVCQPLVRLLQSFYFIKITWRWLCCVVRTFKKHGFKKYSGSRINHLQQITKVATVEVYSSKTLKCTKQCDTRAKSAVKVNNNCEISVNNKKKHKHERKKYKKSCVVTPVDEAERSERSVECAKSGVKFVLANHNSNPRSFNEYYCKKEKKSESVNETVTTSFSQDSVTAAVSEASTSCRISEASELPDPFDIHIEHTETPNNCIVWCSYSDTLMDKQLGDKETLAADPKSADQVPNSYSEENGLDKKESDKPQSNGEGENTILEKRHTQILSDSTFTVAQERNDLTYSETRQKRNKRSSIQKKITSSKEQYGFQFDRSFEKRKPKAKKTKKFVYLAKVDKYCSRTHNIPCFQSFFGVFAIVNDALVYLSHDKDISYWWASYLNASNLFELYGTYPSVYGSRESLISVDFFCVIQLYGSITNCLQIPFLKNNCVVYERCGPYENNFENCPTEPNVSIVEEKTRFGMQPLNTIDSLLNFGFPVRGSSEDSAFLEEQGVFQRKNFTQLLGDSENYGTRFHSADTIGQPLLSEKTDLTKTAPISLLECVSSIEAGYEKSNEEVLASAIEHTIVRDTCVSYCQLCQAFVTYKYNCTDCAFTNSILNKSVYPASPEQVSFYSKPSIPSIP